MSRKYELAKLEAVVAKDISDFVRMNYKLDQTLFRRFIDRIHQETESVKNNFSRAVLYYKNKQALARYIRFHQRAIIELSGQLIKYVPPHEINTVSESSQDKAKLSQELYFSLQELLTFVEKHFAQYFDMDAWIPENFRLIVFDDIQQNVGAIEAGLVKKGFEKELIGLTLAPFKEFLQQGSSNEITYRRIMFLKELRKDLLYLVEEKEPQVSDNINVQLQWTLFGLNYNSQEYVTYCTRQIKIFIDETDEIGEKLERLALVQKLIHQQSPKPAFSYDPGRKILPELLEDWMDEETKYWETRKANQMSHEVKKDFSPSGKFKLRVDLSVAQLAFLIRLFVEVNVIQSPNVKLLIKYVSRIFQTKRSSSLGTGSIHGKYYNAEDNTRKVVKEMLLKMIKHIDKNKGST
jgi:hypothetical protein